MSTRLCRKIAEGQAKGMSMKQIAEANPGLWRNSIIEQAKDDFYCWLHGFGSSRRK